MKTARWIVLAGLTLVPAPALAGSPERLGTSGADELRLPVGVRSLALGGSDVGSVPGVGALYSTTAGIAAGAGSTEVLVRHTRPIAEMDLTCSARTETVGA